MLINSNLRRKIRESRYKILIIVIGIILFLLLLNIIDNSIKNQKEEKRNTSNNSIKQDTIYKPETTVIQGSNIGEEQQEKNSSIIDKFISFCSEGKVEDAYNMLSEGCKEELYQSSKENFANNYIKQVFNTKKTYHIQSWIVGEGYTYKVTFLDDILATGRNEHEIVDYYTIVYENDEYRLNINSYVKEKILNRQVENDDLKIVINKKDIYYEYEIYEFEITNKTDKTILADTTKKQNTIYLERKK